jgi:hypothetical protein
MSHPRFERRARPVKLRWRVAAVAEAVRRNLRLITVGAVCALTMLALVGVGALAKSEPKAVHAAGVGSSCSNPYVYKAQYEKVSVALRRSQHNGGNFYPKAKISPKNLPVQYANDYVALSKSTYKIEFTVLIPKRLRFCGKLHWSGNGKQKRYTGTSSYQNIIVQYPRKSAGPLFTVLLRRR